MAVYVCDIIGSGADGDPYRPAVADHVPVGWSVVDGREDSTQSSGSMLVFCTPTTEQISAMAGDPRIDLMVA